MLSESDVSRRKDALNCLQCWGDLRDICGGKHTLNLNLVIFILKKGQSESELVRANKKRICYLDYHFWLCRIVCKQMLDERGNIQNRYNRPITNTVSVQPTFPRHTSRWLRCKCSCLRTRDHVIQFRECIVLYSRSILPIQKQQSLRA